jgi:hypothetical protein
MAERDSGSSGGRSRQGREQFWRQHVGRQAAGSLSVREYCQQHGLAGPTFYIWRKELRRRDEQKSRSKPVASKQPRQTAGGARRSSSAQFVRVNLEHEPNPSVSMEIVLPGQVKIVVPAGATCRQIREVLVALGAVREGASPTC